MPRSKEVNVKLLDEEFFKQYGLPKYATEESAGMDLRACITDSIIIEPQSRVLIPTGLCIDINDSNLAWILIPKSGLGHKKGFVLGNLVGLIDSDYQQEVGVSGWNTSDVPLTFRRGDFVCQAVLVPVLRVVWSVVDELTRDVDRIGGWGSNGFN